MISALFQALGGRRGIREPRTPTSFYLLGNILTVAIVLWLRHWHSDPGLASRTKEAASGS